jgi:ribose/xylose/arabinose/galactoside ABC-type transport system permease subunit
VELDAIAAVVIGGTLLSGGVGTVLGSLFGVMIQGLIQTYITFDGTLSSWWTKIVMGILLFIFIALQKGMGSYWTTRRARHPQLKTT